jgi:mRNA-degrading endonuclease RelE of RelBE toxin-antitoxin system
MSFEVEWHPAAENQLTNIWLSAPDQSAVTRAAFQIDSTLANDPFGVGESRADNRRILIELPLSVFYEVDTLNRIVHVVSVGSAKPPRRPS